jgi:large subunit ribosomal protein L3
MKFLLAKKLGMTTIYKEAIADNVTLLEVPKNVITLVRTEDKDGYSAVQVGLFDQKKTDKMKKDTYATKREFRLVSSADYTVGQELDASQFEVDQKVQVQGISKGKGQEGVVKKWNFAGSPASHGHRHDERAPGSIGSAFPERVFKGKKMAGRSGSARVTAKGMKVSLVDMEKNIIAVKGSVPGNNGGIVEIVIK